MEPKISYPSKVRCSIGVWCFFYEFVYAFKMVGHSLARGDVSHDDVLFSIETQYMN